MEANKEIKMELSHLRYFSIVAEEENITRAAKRLFISQPALSATIARLEKELGFALFRRDSNRISLTDAGRCFWEYTNNAFMTIQEGVTRAQQIANRNRQCVHVASSLGIVRSFGDDYRQDHPDGAFEVRICNTEEIAERLTNGSADLGINLGPIIDSQFSNQTIMSVPWCVAVNDEHPLRFRESVTLKELEPYQLFCSSLAHTFEKIPGLFARAQCSCKLLCLDERDV
ncbi:MAG: LysR family transcriptional regulator, partial [Clostridia bacterium]|nr:LysR family transcriptional regulator [Clostridia bacterium]